MSTNYFDDLDGQHLGNLKLEIHWESLAPVAPKFILALGTALPPPEVKVGPPQAPVLVRNCENIVRIL